MDTSIPTLVIGAIFLLAASFLARSSITTYDSLGQHVRQLEARAGAQARTKLTVTNVTVDGTGAVVSAQVRNDGQTSIGDWAAVDLIVSYYSGPASRVDTWLPYVSGALAANAWTVQGVRPDAFEPGILNPGETATLQAQVSPAIEPALTDMVVISTETGVTASAQFSR